MQKRYSNRREAGRALGAVIACEPSLVDPLVVALPRGGVPVALEVARALRAPLDVLVVRKIGAPGHAELACGAATADGSVVWNDTVLFGRGITQAELRAHKERAFREARQLEGTLRSGSTPALSAFAKTAVLVDDGLATGATMKAALKSVLLQKPHRIIVAIPVGPEDTCAEIEEMGYRVVCANRVPEGELSSVGEWYEDFSQVDSSVCRAMLEEGRAHCPEPPRAEAH